MRHETDICYRPYIDRSYYAFFPMKSYAASLSLQFNLIYIHSGFGVQSSWVHLPAPVSKSVRMIRNPPDFGMLNVQNLISLVIIREFVSASLFVRIVF